MHQPHDAENNPQQQFLHHLKQATQSRHEALEQNAFSAALLSPGLNLDRYVNILQRFYGFVLPVEEQVYPWLTEVLDPINRFLRAELLRSDLTTLGMRQEQIPALPRMAFLPEVNNLADAFGVVYVLEGSKLGGQFISRHIHQILALTPENGLLFFHGHGREAGRYWNEFRQAMANFAVNSQQQDRIIAAAAHTFDAFNTWLGPEVV